MGGGGYKKGCSTIVWQGGYIPTLEWSRAHPSAIMRLTNRQLDVGRLHQSFLADFNNYDFVCRARHFAFSKRSHTPRNPSAIYPQQPQSEPEHLWPLVFAHPTSHCTPYVALHTLRRIAHPKSH